MVIESARSHVGHAVPFVHQRGAASGRSFYVFAQKSQLDGGQAHCIGRCIDKCGVEPDQRLEVFVMIGWGDEFGDIHQAAQPTLACDARTLVLPALIKEQQFAGFQLTQVSSNCWADFGWIGYQRVHARRWLAGGCGWMSCGVVEPCCIGRGCVADIALSGQQQGFGVELGCGSWHLAAVSDETIEALQTGTH